ncbi:MAG: CoA pyrophosphatase [Pseudomonadales bacterium]|nr:CoA pyrophosphatase [Pseudomonadales bacterium]MCP5329672.1 CoA pyrophosphatase [Pseudomonadales bacterium]MCP5343789.1 CoA pyrophosphatase [Pseudomonadales bacterium]
MTAPEDKDPTLQKLLRFFKQTQAFERRPIQHPDQDINRLEHARELPGGQFRQAAVLIPVITDLDIPAIVLTLRTEHLSSHPGQVAFPGGRQDPGDAGPVHTALRESKEEIGLPADAVRIIGRLGELLMPSGYCVTPVVGLLSSQTPLVPSPGEVAQIFQLPLPLALDTRQYQRKTIQWQGAQRETLEMYHDGYRIWGATAAILHHLAREVDSIPA